MPYENLKTALDYADESDSVLIGASLTDKNLFEAEPSTSITGLLSRVSAGDRLAFDDLIPLVYEELHRIAEAYLRRELQNRTMQPTVLIHEAYLRLIQSGSAAYQNRGHFFGVAARVMRQVLVDHARTRNAAKR